MWQGGDTVPGRRPPILTASLRARRRCLQRDARHQRAVIRGQSLPEGQCGATCTSRTTPAASACSPPTRWTTIIEDSREDDFRFVTANKVLLLELYGDDSLPVRIVVDEPLRPTRRRSGWRARRGSIETSDGRMLVMGGFDPDVLSWWTDDECGRRRPRHRRIHRGARHAGA